MALRLRREGDRWVQTLKGRGDGLMQRLEDEVPVDGPADAVPSLDPARHEGTAAGRALARVLAGGPAPQVLYGTDIRRLRRVLRSGGARIEVALDVGEIQAGERCTPVCEVEFELLDGPLQGLLDLAARWADRYGLVLDVTTKAERGHRLAGGDALPPVARATEQELPADWSADQARAAMVAAALAQALPNAAAITNGRFTPDHVHQLRVALRRLRTVLRVFGPEDAERDEGLAGLFAALGGARDADVMALTLAPAWQAAAASGLPPPATTAAAGPDAAAPALRAPATARLWLQLIALTPAPAVADASWGPLAAERVRRWRRQLRRGFAAWPTLDDEGRHRLRRRLKRLRYLLDFCRGLWPRKALKRELAALRPLQDAMGHWNDIVVARAHLAAWPEPGPAVHFAAGWLAREALAADAACAEAAARWRRLKPLARVQRRG
jgi:inorganic triphosphatase YgiF